MRCSRVLFPSFYVRAQLLTAHFSLLTQMNPTNESTHIHTVTNRNAPYATPSRFLEFS